MGNWGFQSRISRGGRERGKKGWGMREPCDNDSDSDRGN